MLLSFESIQIPHEFKASITDLLDGRQLSIQEAIRAIHFSIGTEFEAVQLYTQLAQVIDNPLVKQTLLKTADEERVHVGEFLRLIQELYPNEAAKYTEGMNEVEDESKR
jgi:rubrerythrin